MRAVAGTTGASSRALFIDVNWWYSIVALLLLTSSFNPVFYALTGADPGSYNNPMKIAVSSVIYLVSVVLIVFDTGPVIRTLLRNPLVPLIFLLPLVSVLWSVDHGLTMKRALAHMLTGLFCIYAASRMTPEEFMRRLTVVFFIGGIASFLYVVAFPQLAIHQGGSTSGSLKGIYGHKAELGRMSVIAVVAAASCVAKTRPQFVIKWATFCMFILLVLLSQSRTNWLVLMALVCLIPMLRLLRLKRISIALRLAPFIAIGIAVITVVAIEQEELLTLMGRDDTFSGRGTLWSSVISIAQAKFPYTGAGYGAFFSPAGGLNQLAEMIGSWRGIPYHAHDGYIMTWIETGYAGLALLVIVICHLAYRLFKKITTEPDRRVWPAFACLLAFFLINNVANSVAFKHGDIAWALMIIGYCFTGAPSATYRTAATAPRPAPNPWLPGDLDRSAQGR
jgi:O-antigen ligase